MEKIVRSICYFVEQPELAVIDALSAIEQKLAQAGFLVQTKRICSPVGDFLALEKYYNKEELFYSLGVVSFEDLHHHKQAFLASGQTACHVALDNETITLQHIHFLWEIAKYNPKKFFDFAFTFNNVDSSPFFPSANYRQEGFSIGLQATNLTQSCTSLQAWFENMKIVWQELVDILAMETDFLGIDSSIAPLSLDNGSLLDFIQRLGYGFKQSQLSDCYLQMTQFIKAMNPKPVGLCGLMLPCLEDFVLASQYQRGDFSLQDNLFLSLHSGLGIDTYPFGLDEDPQALLAVLRLVQGLSNKYQKPLSVRFINDGKANIGDKMHFNNPHLCDVICRKI